MPRRTRQLRPKGLLPLGIQDTHRAVKRCEPRLGLFITSPGTPSVFRDLRAKLTPTTAKPKALNLFRGAEDETAVSN